MIETKTKSFDWLASLFYPAALILMEALWVSPWLTWLGLWPLYSQPRPALNLASVIIVLGVSLAATRFFASRSWSTARVQLAIIGGGLVIILLVLAVEYRDGLPFLSGEWFAATGRKLAHTFEEPYPVIIALPALFYLWWRGINLGRAVFSFRDVYRAFLTGVVALIVLILFWRISSASGGMPAAGPGVGLNVVAFFFFGLIAMAISHLYLMRQAMPREEAALTSVRRWLPIMLAVIGGMVILVFVLAGIFSPEFFAAVSSLFKAIGGILARLLGFFLVPVFYLIEGAIRLFWWFLNLFRQEQPLPEGENGQPPFPELQPATPVVLPEALTLIIKWLAVAVITVVVVYFLARAVSRARARRSLEGLEEIHESLFSWGGLKDDLKELLKAMGDRFRRHPSPGRFMMDEDDTRRMGVRDIYRHLLRQGSISGFTRRDGETPLEYARRLEKDLPGAAPPVHGLTEMYHDVRYGEAVLPADKVDAANGLWYTLRAIFRGLQGG